MRLLSKYMINLAMISVAACTQQTNSVISQPKLKHEGISSPIAGAFSSSTTSPTASKQEKLAEARVSLEAVDSTKLSPDLREILSSVKQDLRNSENQLKKLKIVEFEQLTGTIIGAATGSIAGQLIDTRPKLPFEASVISATTLKGGPDPNSLNVMPLRAGAKVAVLEEAGSWYHVMLTDPEVEGYVLGALLEPRGKAEDPATKHLSKPYVSVEPAAFNDQMLSYQKASEPSLIEKIEKLTDLVEQEGANFRSPAFQCRNELQLCRKSEFGWLDCELTMLVCLADVLVSN